MNHSHKKCSVCNLIKPRTEFFKMHTGKDKQYTYCKICYYNKKIVWKEKNKTKVRDYARKEFLRKKYNLTISDYNEMLLVQKNKCAICGTHQEKLKQILCIDHNHKTGKIRGLLCLPCNTGIGSLKDDYNVVKQALNYLEKDM